MTLVPEKKSESSMLSFISTVWIVNMYITRGRNWNWLKKKRYLEKIFGGNGYFTDSFDFKILSLKVQRRTILHNQVLLQFPLPKRCCLNHVSNLEPELTDERVNNWYIVQFED